MLTASLERLKAKEFDVEREHEKELALLNEKVKVLKRQVEASESEGNTRFQQASSDRDAADWQRKAALERVAVLETQKRRESERALNAEGVAAEKESELVTLRREIEGIKDIGRRASDDYKRKWQTAVDELQRETCEGSIKLSSFPSSTEPNASPAISRDTSMTKLDCMMEDFAEMDWEQAFTFAHA